MYTDLGLGPLVKISYKLNQELEHVNTEYTAYDTVRQNETNCPTLKQFMGKHKGKLD